MSMNDKYKHTLRDTPLLKDVRVSLKFEKWQIAFLFLLLQRKKLEDM